MNRRTKLLTALLILFGALMAGCGSETSSFNSPCLEKEALFCEDFEGDAPNLGGSTLLESSVFDQWWVTSDNDQEYFFQEFPFSGRSQGHMVLLSDGIYKNQSKSFYYAVEIDLTSATRAVLQYNLIYKTEKHWDGLVVFAIKDGAAGVNDSKNWIILTPEEGYPDTIHFDGTIIPGYSGFNIFWDHEEIDLSPVLGQKIIFGFYFVSDEFLDDWGVGLDDITVIADAGYSDDQTGGAVDLVLVNLDFAQDAMITHDIPRLNPVVDTICEGAEEELLKVGQRAFVKAINESADRVLILHPESGSLCWTDLNNSWIEGEIEKLPYLSDLKPEDFYLPICGYNQSSSPVDPGCLEDETLSRFSSPLPYRIQSALVAEGKITTLLLVPFIKGEEVNKSIDNRIGDQGLYPEIDPEMIPGGRFWVDINGSEKTCLMDRDDPGRVVCSGLSLDAAGPIEVNICWQGWHSTQSCPPGFVMGPGSEGCLPIELADSCVVNCPAGYQFDTQLETCLLSQDSIDLESIPELCPPGFSANQEAGCCVGTEYVLESNCPPGYFYSPEQSVCQPLSANGECPEAYDSRSSTEVCIPEIFPISPWCNLIQMEFLKTEATVKESLRCLKNPENNTEIVSSLRPFTDVEVLGLGEDGETLVVNNPVYQIPCWAPLDGFYLDSLDLTILPVIIPE